LVTTKGVIVQNEANLLTFVGTKEDIGGSLLKKVAKGLSNSATWKGGEEVKETCQYMEKAETTGGPDAVPWHLLVDAGRVPPLGNRFQSESVPPTRFANSFSNLGLEEQFGPMREDSISLVELRGGGANNFEQQQEASAINSSSFSECQRQTQRGRSRKRAPRPKKIKIEYSKMLATCGGCEGAVRSKGEGGRGFCNIQVPKSVPTMGVLFQVILNMMRSCRRSLILQKV
jgi:hypothetical protein